MTPYRNNGAVGALLDEYERALRAFQERIASISETALLQEVPDKDFPTIQQILAHVLRAGYYYAIHIRQHYEEYESTADYVYFTRTKDYVSALNEMFQYTEKVFIDFPDLRLEEYDEDKKILSGWGQSYSVEQLMEHAIVHILRHRRQIERRLLLLETSLNA